MPKFMTFNITGIVASLYGIRNDLNPFDLSIGSLCFILAVAGAIGSIVYMKSAL